MKKIIGFSLLFLVIDQITKFLVISFIALNNSVGILGSFFRFTYIKNFGAAFSILEGGRVFLIFIALATLGLIYFVFIRNKEMKNVEYAIYGMLIGGVLGNLIDRIVHGYVIDFLHFKIFNKSFPIFNLADVFIVLSVGIILFITMGEENEKNNSK